MNVLKLPVKNLHEITAGPRIKFRSSEPILELQSRQWLNILSSRRKPSNPSPERMAASFAKAETDRQAKFDASMARYQHLFASDETTQWEGEHHRSAESDRLLASLDESFKLFIENHKQSFHDLDSRHQETFLHNEGVRDRQSAEAEDRRMVLFRQSQDIREIDTKWYADTRHARFERGREERAETCRKLKEDLQDLLESVLRDQEERFISAERKRDETLREIVSSLSSSYKTAFS